MDGVTESKDKPRSKHRGETTMNHYAGIDVSLECSCVCVIDANGKILREAKVASEPEALVVGWAKALLRRAHHPRCGLQGGHASLCPPCKSGRFPIHLSNNNEDARSHSRGRFSPGLCYLVVPFRKERAQGKPGADRTRSLV